MPDDPATGGRDGVGAGQRRERGLAAAAAGVGEADHGLGGGDRSDTVPVGETGRDVGHDGQQLAAIALELLAGLLQRERKSLDLGMTHGMVAAGRGGQRAEITTTCSRDTSRRRCVSVPVPAIPPTRVAANLKIHRPESPSAVLRLRPVNPWGLRSRFQASW
jgi:hypothetical protein